MGMIAERIIRLTKARDLKTDSTPLEASRYDKHSDYNPHYGCKMDKAHITLIGFFPLYMIYTNGLANDSPELDKHIDFLKKYNMNIDSYALDSGYDSFENHADIWYHLKVKPTIPPKCNAVINMEGTIERINHWINKLWKKGGSIHMPIAKKLELLYENGRRKHVGMYLKNQALVDEKFEEKIKTRQPIERSNRHIKGRVTFDVRKIQTNSRELYSIVRFVAYQFMILTNLQNKIENINLDRYF
ncbi:transposase [uncultured Methanomethylovorans sp.]|uniref:transposase n=1 Tax=uncultured Methanomethylovorans sp. TaxID=183759 RepID=UPI003748354F